MIHDWDDVGKALAGSGTAGQDIGFAFLGLADRLGLMGVEKQLLTRVIGVGFVDPKDPGALRV
jgi:hypothetical protein